MRCDERVASEVDEVFDKVNVGKRQRRFEKARHLCLRFGRNPRDCATWPRQISLQ